MYEGAMAPVGARERLERITDTAAGSGSMKANKSKQIFRALQRISGSDGVARPAEKASIATLAGLGIKIVEEKDISRKGAKAQS